jgi:hypothetical protein
MKQYLLLTVDSMDRFPNTTQHETPEQAFIDAIILIDDGAVFCWQIQRVLFSKKRDDGSIECVNIPIAQSPNWAEMTGY